MRQDLRIAAGIAAVTLLAGGLLASDAAASGVGASIYVPAKARPMVQQTSCQTGACSPHADCAGCQRLGFACVDHATPPPCTAEGGCYPKRNTFGFYATKWRRWPGAVYGGPSPETAGPAGDLPPIEPPAPSEEDKSSPPPIEDAPSPQDEGDGESGFDPPTPTPPAFNGELPNLEIDLPPLPEIDVPGFPAGPSPEGGPPALPFGSVNPRETSPSEADGWSPPRPSFGASPAVLRKPAAQDDPPPALPAGFTGTQPAQLLRRLPTTRPLSRYDGSVQQASAYQPVR